jgi:AraC family transcriptional regulator
MLQPIEEVEVPRLTGIAIRATLPIAELPRFFGGAFAELEGAAGAARVPVAGVPFARYLSVAPEAVEVEAVLPTGGRVAPSGRIIAVDIPAGKVAQVKHIGPYDDVGAAYHALDAWIAERHRERAGAPREVYLTDPGAVRDPARWETLVVQPIL